MCPLGVASEVDGMFSTIFSKGFSRASSGISKDDVTFYVKKMTSTSAASGFSAVTHSGNLKNPGLLKLRPYEFSSPSTEPVIDGEENVRQIKSQVESF